MLTEADPASPVPASPAATRSRLFYLLRHLDVTRGHTRRLAERVPADHLEWAPGPGLLSIADRFRQIASSGRWIYVEAALGLPTAYPGHGADLCYGREGVLAYLDGLHTESLTLLRSMSEAELDRPVQTVNGADVPVWRWLQMMVEEEAQIRGQIELLLAIAHAQRSPLARTA